MVVFVITVAGCDCGDDDDDDDANASDDDSGDDDSGDDDSGDDDTAGDDDTTADDDTTGDDDDDDDDTPISYPTANCIPPVDYDGDGENEIFMSMYTSTSERQTHYMLLDPSTWTQETILSYVGDGLYPDVSMADFDNNGIWDVVVSLRTISPKALPVGSYEIYMNGEFSEPAQEFGPFEDCDARAMPLDIDNDGFPELLINIAGGGCKGGKSGEVYRVLDPANEWAMAVEISGGATEFLSFLHNAEGTSVFPTAASVTASDVHELVVRVEYEDGGSTYEQFRVYDTQTGARNAVSDPINVGIPGYSSFRLGDLDGDGTHEIFMFRTYTDPITLIKTSQVIILGGADLDEVFSTTEVTDLYTSAGPVADFNLDGVNDIISTLSSPSTGTAYTGYTGVGGYAELFDFSSPVGHSSGVAYYFGRNDAVIGYDFTGDDNPDLALYDSYPGGSGRVGELSFFDIDSNTLGAAVRTIDLGASGNMRVSLTDFANDGALDLALLSTYTTWTGSEWEYDLTMQVFQGEALTEIFNHDAGSHSTQYIETNFDLTGDWAPDLILFDWDYTSPVHNTAHVFDCDATGCSEVGIIAGSGFTVMFYGPFL